MSVLDSLKKWFSAVTDPLCGANKVADDLNSAHQDFMRGFASIMSSMMAQQVAVKAASSTATDLVTTMSGNGAEAISSEALSYLQVSATVTPTPDLALAGVSVRGVAGVSQGATEVSQLTEFGELSSQTVADIEEALANAAEKIGEDAALDTVTEVVDGAAVAEAGANPIADAAAIILTIIAAAFFLKALYDMAWAIYDAIQAWQKAATNTCQPLPQLPPTPQQPAGPSSPQNSLTPAQEDLAKRLFADYGSLGLSLDDIRKIIEDNPNLTEAQLRDLLAQYANVIKANPNLVSKYGALAIFEEFIALAAYDAAHGGNYALRKPVANMSDLQPGIEEAMAEMGAMEQGKVPWPLTPSLEARYDAKDPNGTEWDEKSYRSINTNGKAYNAKDTVDALQKDFGKGEKIIFDDSRLTQQEIDDTYDELKKRNQENDVVWWPNEPTQLKSTP